MIEIPATYLDDVLCAVLDAYRKHWQEDPITAGRSLEFILCRVEGLYRGRRELLREETLANLAERFGPVPADVADRVNALTDEPRLRKLRKLALTAPTLEAFVAELTAEVR